MAELLSETNCMEEAENLVRKAISIRERLLGKLPLDALFAVLLPNLIYTYYHCRFRVSFCTLFTWREFVSWSVYESSIKYTPSLSVLDSYSLVYLLFIITYCTNYLHAVQT